MLTKHAENEDGLTAIKGMANLKEFIYPVKDLSIYKGCKKIEKIGIASSSVHGFEALEGSNVNEFFVCGEASGDIRYLDQIAEEMSKHVKHLYGYTDICPCSYSWYLQERLLRSCGIPAG